MKEALVEKTSKVIEAISKMVVNSYKISIFAPIMENLSLYNL